MRKGWPKARLPTAFQPLRINHARATAFLVIVDGGFLAGLVFIGHHVFGESPSSRAADGMRVDAIKGYDVVGRVASVRTKRQSWETFFPAISCFWPAPPKRRNRILRQRQAD